MIRIATRQVAGSENGSPMTDVPAELVEVTARMAGVLRDLWLLGRGSVLPDESQGEATATWADDDYLYIEANVADDLGTSIDVSTCGRRFLVRIERSPDHQRRQPRATRRDSEPADRSRGPIRRGPTIRIGR